MRTVLRMNPLFEFAFFRTSVPKGLSYPSTAPALNIVGNDYSRVNVSSVGPSVETTFEVGTVRIMQF